MAKRKQIDDNYGNLTSSLTVGPILKQADIVRGAVDCSGAWP